MTSTSFSKMQGPRLPCHSAWLSGLLVHLLVVAMPSMVLVVARVPAQGVRLSLVGRMCDCRPWTILAVFSQPQLWKENNNGPFSQSHSQVERSPYCSGPWYNNSTTITTWEGCFCYTSPTIGEVHRVITLQEAEGGVNGI